MGSSSNLFGLEKRERPPDLTFQTKGGWQPVAVCRSRMTLSFSSVTQGSGTLDVSVNRSVDRGHFASDLL